MPVIRESSVGYSTKSRCVFKERCGNGDKDVTTQYHSSLPASCPPSEAAHVNAKLFKAINGRQPNTADFESFAEQNRDGFDKSECQSWGLSVWPHMEAVHHALKVYKFFGKKHIIEFAITPADGSLLMTPSAKQPDHCTFWRYKNCNLLNSCQVVINPGKTA